MEKDVFVKVIENLRNSKTENISDTNNSSGDCLRIGNTFFIFFEKA